MSKPIIKLTFFRGCVVFSHVDLKGFKRRKVLCPFIKKEIQEIMLNSFYKNVIKAIVKNKPITCEVCDHEPDGECEHPKNGYCAKFQRQNK